MLITNIVLRHVTVKERFKNGLDAEHVTMKLASG